MTSRRIIGGWAVAAAICALSLTPHPSWGQEPPQQLRVSVDHANVRSGPGTEHSIVLTVPRGTIVTVTEAAGPWFRIRLTPELGSGREEGFIHDSVVQEFTPAPVARPVPSAAAHQIRVTAAVANVRSDPEPDAPVMSVVAAGTVLVALSREDDWFEVRLDPGPGGGADRGFIRESDVKEVEFDPETDHPPQHERHRDHDDGDPQPEAAAIPVVQSEPERSALEERRRFGAGVTVTVPGGLVPLPTVIYDARDRLTVKGMIGIGSGFTVVFGEVLFRWPVSADAQSSVGFEPFVGGGTVVVTGRFGSESFSGGAPFLSGGLFLHLNEHPQWRLQGTVNSVLVFTVTTMSVAYFF